VGLPSVLTRPPMLATVNELRGDETPARGLACPCSRIGPCRIGRKPWVVARVTQPSSRIIGVLPTLINMLAACRGGAAP
jgi:hypothetical protein